MNIFIHTLFASIFLPTLAFANSNQCALSSGITIQTSSRMLFICEHDKAIRHYKISLGRNGIGKNYRGDNKTPVGLYELGAPRMSKKFGKFIPIKYPTQQQKLSGFTGNDLGIHGPLQFLSWLGTLNTWFNWTQGCIAVGNNEDIGFITTWVSKHPQAQIFIQ